MRVLLLGGTGTIGRATARALLDAGHAVLALVRPEGDIAALEGCTLVPGLVTQPSQLEAAFKDQDIDAVISCIASRTGVPKDAWDIDYRGSLSALSLAEQHGVTHFVLLSAICVQKPKLAFQKAKLAFETHLQESPLTWSIVRPTAFFKSLSGQIDRLRAGKPFLMFGDGVQTACKPISDQDLAHYLARCLDDPMLQNKVLPIGGPGPAITPKEQGQMLFDALECPAAFKRVPPEYLKFIGQALGVVGAVIPPLREKAELARIGYYYATESMLVWDAERSAYSAEATPEFGSDRLEDHYKSLVADKTTDDRGPHKFFK